LLRQRCRGLGRCRRDGSRGRWGRLLLLAPELLQLHERQ
jgi:hypothetical protein